MKYYYLLSIVVLFILGCAHTINTDNSDRTKIFSANYFEVNKAVNNYLTAEGWKIENVDETHGLIQTAFRWIKSLYGNHQIKLSLTLHSLPDNQTKIEVNVLTLVSSGVGKYTRGTKEQNVNESESEEYCKQIFEGVENRIKH